MTRIGCIGLGAMGMGVARSLLRKGFEVHACDVREAARQSIAGEGAIAHATPAALAARVLTQEHIIYPRAIAQLLHK